MPQLSPGRREFLKAAGTAALTSQIFTGNLKGANDKVMPTSIAAQGGVALDWDDKAFTVKQHDIKPFLKAKYRGPWKLEV